MGLQASTVIAYLKVKIGFLLAHSQTKCIRGMHQPRGHRDARCVRQICPKRRVTDAETGRQHRSDLGAIELAISEGRIRCRLAEPEIPDLGAKVRKPRSLPARPSQTLLFPHRYAKTRSTLQTVDVKMTNSKCRRTPVTSDASLLESAELSELAGMLALGLAPFTPLSGRYCLALVLLAFPVLHQPVLAGCRVIRVRGDVTHPCVRGAANHPCEPVLAGCRRGDLGVQSGDLGAQQGDLGSQRRSSQVVVW